MCLFFFCVGSHGKQWKDVLPFLLGNSLEKGREGGCCKMKNAVQNCLVTLTLEYWCCRHGQGWAKLRLDLICLEICQWQDHLLSSSFRKVGRKVSREKENEINLKNKSRWKNSLLSFFWFPIVPMTGDRTALHYSFPHCSPPFPLHSFLLQRACCCNIERSYYKSHTCHSSGLCWSQKLLWFRYLIRRCPGGWDAILLSCATFPHCHPPLPSPCQALKFARCTGTALNTWQRKAPEEGLSSTTGKLNMAQGTLVV